MLEDIIFLNKFVFEKFIHKQVKINPIDVYDTYRGLQNVILDTKLVAEHYLVLTFEEEFLQNSSFGSPKDKWRRFLNEDLKKLNSSIKQYILLLYRLQDITQDYLFETFLSELYNCKKFYGFIKNDYNIGKIKVNSLQIKSTILKINDFQSDIEKSLTIDLSTYEKRKKLKKDLVLKKSILQKQFNQLKKYILKHFSIEDLVLIRN